MLLVEIGKQRRYRNLARTAVVIYRRRLVTHTRAVGVEMCRGLLRLTCYNGEQLEAECQDDCDTVKQEHSPAVWSLSAHARRNIMSAINGAVNMALVPIVSVECVTFCYHITLACIRLDIYATKNCGSGVIFRGRGSIGIHLRKSAFLDLVARRVAGSMYHLNA